MSTSPRHEVVRRILIRARREAVFRYFTDSERFATWWGAGSRIDARPGGALLICYPGGTTASGQVREVVPGERIVFSYGYDDPEKPIPPGGSTVEVSFADEPGGTRVTLRHLVDSPELVRSHEPGWRYQLALFSRVASAEQHAGAEGVLDAWFAAWAETDSARRGAALAACASDDVVFHDDFGALSGRADLDSHIAATHVHMPGVKLERVGKPQLSHGAALVHWRAVRPDGNLAGSGTSFVDFSADGRIARVAGFWGA